jgi:hypothetical protein
MLVQSKAKHVILHRGLQAAQLRRCPTYQQPTVLTVCGQTDIHRGYLRQAIVTGTTDTQWQLARWHSAQARTSSPGR